MLCSYVPEMYKRTICQTGLTLREEFESWMATGRSDLWCSRVHWRCSCAPWLYCGVGGKWCLGRPVVWTTSSAAPTHNSKQDSTGHHRLVEHPQHRPADVKGPRPPQKVESALALFGNGFGGLCPVQIRYTLRHIGAYGCTDSMSTESPCMETGVPAVFVLLTSTTRSFILVMLSCRLFRRFPSQSCTRPPHSYSCIQQRQSHQRTSEDGRTLRLWCRECRRGSGLFPVGPRCLLTTLSNTQCCRR